MEKIASFRINHLTLQPGVYTSRVDSWEGSEAMATTYDVRMTAPNREPALSAGALHAMEHLAATLLRNHPQYGDKIIYWGPMGCHTGNYLIMKGKPDSAAVIGLLTEVMQAIADWDDEVPGASPRDCGNYLMMHLPEAKMAARKYLDVLRNNCPTRY